jgi:peroxiredoxin
MAASLKQDYAKILNAGAELVMISSDSLEQHRQYALALFGEDLPYLFVSDSDLDIARRYGLLREQEHHHRGFYYRSLWILDRDATIIHKSLPWGRQRRGCRVPEIIHAHRQRTRGMASHHQEHRRGERGE